MSNFRENLKPYHNLVKNFTSLSLLQIANYIFPLIVLPYLVRVLGPAKYGLVSFAFAFNAYFLTLCDYGFNLSGIRSISADKNNNVKISEIFTSIILIKLFLCLLSFLILIILVFSIQRFNNEWETYLLSFGFVLGNVLFPLWFYQGIEEMKYITIIRVAVKTIATILIFILIAEETDYLIYVLLTSSAQILIGVTGLIFAVYKFNIHISLPSIEKVKQQLKDGWNIFLSLISINLYTTSNTFILGLFAPDILVGYFSAADKIRLAFQGIISVISQAAFPSVNNLLKESFNKFSSFIKKLLVVESISGITISLILFFFAEEISAVILGNEFVESVLILKIISLLPFLISLSNVFGIQVMLPLGFDKQFNLILAIAAVIHIILQFFFVPAYLTVGISITIVITETLVTLMMFIFIKRTSSIF